MGCLRERFLTLTHLPVLSDVDGVDGALPAASVQFSLPVHLGPFPQHQRRGSPRRAELHIYVTTPTRLVQYLGEGAVGCGVGILPASHFQS